MPAHPPTPDRPHHPRPSAPAPPKPGAEPEWTRLHLWQIQWVRDLLIIAAIVGVVFLGYTIRVVTVPMLIALALAYLFEPLVKWLCRRGLFSRRGVAIGIIAGTALLIGVPVTLGTGFAVVQGAKVVGELAANISRVKKSVDNPDNPDLRAAVPPGAWTSIRDFLRPPESAHPAPAPGPPGSTAAGGPGPDESPPAPIWERLAGSEERRELAQRFVAWVDQHADELSASLSGRVATSGAEAARAAFHTATSAGLLVFQAVLTGFFFYFFSTGWGRVMEFWGSFIPETRRTRAAEILGKMDRAIAGFVRGRVTICAILAVYFTIAYWLAGVPMPIVLGPIVGMMCIVPYLQSLGALVVMLLLWLGGVHGPIFAPGMAAASGGLWWVLLAPPAIHLVAHGLDEYLLNPSIQGKHTELSIPTIIFASIAGGALAGIYGLLVAIPVAACLRILAKEVFWPRMQAWVRGEVTDLLPIGKE